MQIILIFRIILQLVCGEKVVVLKNRGKLIQGFAKILFTLKNLMKSEKFVYLVLFLKKLFLVKFDIGLILYFLCTVILVNDYLRASAYKLFSVHPEGRHSAKVQKTHVQGAKTKVSALDSGAVADWVIACGLVRVIQVVGQ